MPYDYEKKRGTIRHIYVRVGEKSGESQLTLISATKKMPGLDVLVERLRAAAPSLTGILLNHNQRDDNVILGDRTDVLWGEPRRFIRSTTRRPSVCMRVRWTTPV